MANLGIAMSIKDDVEIIKLNIDYHLNLGVKKIYILDFNSTDGTRAVLEEYKNNDCVDLTYINQDIYPHLHLQKEMRCRLYDDDDVDLILHLDADEFLFLNNYTFDEFISFIRTDITYIRRFNVVPIEPLKKGLSKTVLENVSKLLYFNTVMQEKSSDASIIDSREVFLSYLWSKRIISLGIPFEKDLIHEEKIHNYYPQSLLEWLQHSLVPPRLIHRKVPIRLDIGRHYAVSEMAGYADIPSYAFIAHFPMTSFKRFETKSNNIVKFIESHSEERIDSLSFHWKIHYLYHKHQLLDVKYNDLFMKKTQIKQKLINKELLTTDDIFQMKNGRGVTVSVGLPSWISEEEWIKDDILGDMDTVPYNSLPYITILPQIIKDRSYFLHSKDDIINDMFPS